MGIIFFLLVIGAVVFLFLLIDLGLSAFSAMGGYDNDPYEEELKLVDYDDVLLARRGGDAFADTDARPAHFYNKITQKTPFPSSNVAGNRKISGVL